MQSSRIECLGALSSDSASQLDVLGHDGHTLGVDGAQVGVLEQSNQVGLSGLLQSSDGRGLEAQISLEILSNLTNQSLERQLSQQQLSGLLVSSDLSQGHGSGAEAVRLLHSSGSGTSLTGGLGSHGLTGSLSSGRFTSGLLSSSHFSKKGKKMRKEERVNK